MGMNRNKIRDWFRYEWRDYMADLRDIIQALHHAGGWITLGLILMMVAVVAVWFITGLGFGETNASNSISLSSRHCQPVSNFSGVLLFIDVVMMFLLGVMALGEMLQVLSRLRQGYPPQPRWVTMLAAGMVVVGVAGIVYMRFIC